MGLSRRAYAKRRGLSDASIRRHISSGLLAPAVQADDTIDPDAADRLLKTLRTRGDDVPVQLAAARTRRLRAKVALSYDELQKLETSMVDPRWAEWEFGQFITEYVWPNARKLG